MNKKDKQHYETLKKFWGQSLANFEPAAIDETWITNEKVNEIFNKYINNESVILDYGCGSGWAIFEADLKCHFKKGIGIDTTEKCIENNNKIAELSHFDNVSFLSGDETILNDYQNTFDFVMSINVLDVVPDEIVDKIIDSLNCSLKEGGFLFIGLNPDFSEDELLNLLKMDKDGHYFFKNGVLRANKKSIEEWTNLLKEKFEIIETFKFALVPQEEAYPRVGFLLRKR